jgi:hypothetical protein
MGQNEAMTITSDFVRTVSSPKWIAKPLQHHMGSILPRTKTSPDSGGGKKGQRTLLTGVLPKDSSWL